MTNLAAFPVRRYSGGAMAFHWSMAVLIAVVGIVGLLFDDMPKGFKGQMVNLHAVFGCVILVLLAGRIWWRVTHRPPPLPARTGRFSRQASALGHLVLYALMGLVPLAGLVYQFARARGIDFGLFQIAPLLDQKLTFVRTLGNVHSLSAYVLLVLAAGHIMAALAHQYVFKDQLLGRMMPVAKTADVAAPASLKSS